MSAAVTPAVPLAETDGGGKASAAPGSHAQPRPVRKRRKVDKGRQDNDDPSPHPTGGDASRKESLTGALARALVGTLAFVFRAPVRLFRPVKLSSWSLLDAMAQREGRNLSFRYLRMLIRREKSTFLPHLLIPPLLVNTTIGFCLFEAYTLTESHLVSKYYPRKEAAQRLKESQDVPASSKAQAVDTFTPLWIVALAGGAAGTAQCIVSAPLDNVRIVLMSNVKKVNKHQHGASHHPLRISWTAVARAAILPFAPEVTRSKMIQKVKDASQISTEKANAAKAESQRQQWERRLKRWRGGVHGAGLFMSLARDSVGFSAFFVVFEVSRRVAFHVSLSVDRAISYFSATAALPVGVPASANAKMGEVSVDAYDEDNEEVLRRSGDISYSRSRTKTARIIAALVLVIGGAIGAAIYEVVGRPAELMRLVVWEGRKAWEEGRQLPTRKARTERPLVGRKHVCGARTDARNSARRLGPSVRRGGFLDVRSGNTTGTMLSRLEAVHLQNVNRPRHPLKVVGKTTAVMSPKPTVQHTHKHTTGMRRKRTGQLRVKVPANARAAHSSKPRAMPSLSTRPSAYSLLLEHALRTSSLRFSSARDAALRIHPTPVPKAVLLFHTYFIAPFNTSETQHAKATHHTEASQKSKINPTGTAHTVAGSSSKPGKSTFDTSSTTLLKRFAPVRRLLTLFNYRYPQSNAPGGVRTVTQARAWGSGRAAWALRRLASPYGVGFMVFAWMSGDLSA